MNALTRARPVLAYLNICLIWGSSNLITKIGVGSLPPLQFSCIRFLTAGILLSVLCFACGDKTRLSKKELFSLALIGALLNFLTNSCVVVSNTLLDSGIVTLMLATIPIFTTLIEVFILKSASLNQRVVIGLIGGFGGIFIVALYGSSGIQISFIGICMSLAAAVFWASGSIYSKNQVIRGSIFKHAAIEALFASILLFIAANLTGQFTYGMLTPSSLYPIFFLALFDSVIGFTSYIYLLKVWPAPTVCTYAYINPVVALILGDLVLGEAVTTGKIAGMAVILASVFLISTAKPSKKDVTAICKKREFAHENTD